VPYAPGRSSEQPGLALVLEAEAFAVDVDDGRVAENAIEHRHREHAVAGKSAVPTAEGQIRGEDYRAAFIALGNDLEEEVRLLAADR
jgi:hypothetical protein